ncbi:palmitoyltransferase ZDHHC23-A [Danaus plexippus]|uniref:palmitoyltransferase ZDHHC23-A n=1 Tax=Danaus plexippus TaxID=13037 RepID=UPI002AB05825|nr:palmitoyltransferase ZDHHC23-A [Danaus plexippus]
MVASSMTIQDILPYGSNKSNSKKLDIDAILPFIILPLLLVICTLSRLVTIIVMILIGMGALYAQSRPRNKNRSPFFYHWTISSGICMFLVFEFGILSLLEITQLENLIFLVLLSSTCYFFYKMKAVADFELATGGSKGKEYSPVLTSDSYYCQICQIEVNERFFHSIWWDCCVLRPNYIYFLSGQIFSFATLLYGTNLGLTTVCQPYILYGNILMPEDCNDVYYEFDLALCFVSCIYGLGYLLVTSLVLIRQILIYIPKYTEPQWKKLINVLTV